MCWETFSVDHLHVEYRRRGMPTKVGVEMVNIEGIKKGDIVLVKGDNGCGKTTLIKALIGEIPSSGGGVALDDFTISIHEFARDYSLSYVPQSPILGVVQSMSVRENILLRSVLHKNHITDLECALSDITGTTRVQELPGLEFLSDSKLAGDMRALSGGQLQFVNLLSCLLSKPEFVFMDEPTSNISDARVQVFWDLFLRIKPPDMVTIVTSHQDKLIDGMATVTVKMLDGKVDNIVRIGGGVT